MKHFKKALCGLLAASMMVSMAACGGATNTPATTTPAATDSTAASGDTILRLTCTTTPDTCDPAKGSGENDDNLYVNVYEALVKPNTADGSAEPWLATEWAYDEATNTYTFQLRDDVVFADGAAFTAADVKYSMDRMLAINDGYAYLYTNYVDSTEVIDERTVAFHLNQTYGPFISSLEKFYILNATAMTANTEAAGDYGENGDYGTKYLLNHSAGSGAYEVTAFEVNNSYKLAQNAAWWGEAGEAAPKNVEMMQLTDAATSKMLLQSGEVDLLHGHQESSTVASLTAGGYQSAAVEEYGLDYFMINTKSQPTDDVHIRKAISYACDYDAMSKIYGGCAPATGPIPSSLWGYSADTTQFTYDLEKAKAEIAQSAYADSLASHPIEIDYIQGNGETGKLCMLLAEALQSVGFTVSIEEVPWVSFCDNETDVSTSPNITNCFVTASYPEAGSLLETKYASWTLGNYNQNEWLQDDALDAMILDALSTVNDDERSQKYAEIQRYITGEVVPSVYTFVSTAKPVWNAASFDWCVAEGNIRGVLEWNFYYNDFTMLG
ncbi:MAG: ABC transporter substrate-binding protein [Oscillospiraceae bacterium]|nr:ABC transporter substrate-binding protein [Oscillospiraceae bacterium]